MQCYELHAVFVGAVAGRCTGAYTQTDTLLRGGLL